jgi:hypothetical protein
LLIAAAIDPDQSDLCRRLFLSAAVAGFPAGDCIMLREDDVLTIAVQYVAEAMFVVERQRQRVARLKAEGAATQDAERTLEVLEGTLELLEEHECMMRELSGRLH